MNMESQIQNVNVDLIIPNRFQPRLTFDENALNELAKSIKEHGIIQPLVLRRLNDKYEIIAGERRYKAAQLAGLTEVPAIITDIDDNKSAEVALVENVQRKNLNSMEEARSYKKILDKGYLTQEALAQKMGISQSTLANKLRLLNLAPEVQEALVNNRISERHARSLLLVDDKLRQISLLNRIIAERLTVRQLDAIIKEGSEQPTSNVVTPVQNINVPKGETLANETVPSLENINSNNEVLDLEPRIMENSQLINNEQNIFDNPSEVNNQEVNFSNPTIAKHPINEETKEEVSTPIESLDTLDILDDEDDKKIEKAPNALNNFFNKITAPKFSSLEDEVTNMNLDTEDYFNPFNNLNEAESLPVKEPVLEELTEKEEIKEEVVNTPEVQIEKKSINKGDLSSVKKAYEELKKEIEAAGFKISVEDFDFEDIYQLIIKIDKQA